MASLPILTSANATINVEGGGGAGGDGQANHENDSQGSLLGRC